MAEESLGSSVDPSVRPTFLSSSSLEVGCKQSGEARTVTQSEDDVPEDSQSKRIKLVGDVASSSAVFPAVTPVNGGVVPPETAMKSATTNCNSIGRTPLTCKKEIESLLMREAGYNSAAATTSKRTDYISFDDYFMSAAVVSSLRSKDPVNATGACIVDSSNNRIIGTGYNGFPMGCSDDVLPWDATSSEHWLHTSAPYAVEAEVNAILNKVTADCTGARLYTQQFPSADSAKVIIQSGIAEVVYMESNNRNNYNRNDKEEESIRASRILLTMAGVTVRQYIPAQEQVLLDFTKVLDASDSGCCDEMGKNSTDCAYKDNRHKPKGIEPEHRELLVKEVNYDPLTTASSKRKDALSWDDYFLSMAFLAAQRSKDPNTQVGACIVDTNKRIVGLGYNGFPRGCSDDDLPWARQSEQGELHKKYVYVCHAEVNAVMNKGSADVRGATLYVALFPCNECAKVIVQAGIREVVYMSDRYHDTDGCRASRVIFQMAGVKLRKHIPSPRSICIQLAKSTGTISDVDRSSTSSNKSDK